MIIDKEIRQRLGEKKIGLAFGVSDEITRPHWRWHISQDGITLADGYVMTQVGERDLLEAVRCFAECLPNDVYVDF